MPIIQNFALHPFDFPLKETKERPLQRLNFPAGVNAGGGKVTPSETFVDEIDLATLNDHDIGGVWFGPDALVVKPAAQAEKRDEGDDAPVGPSGGDFVPGAGGDSPSATPLASDSSDEGGSK